MDETTDVATKEQVSICLRSVSADLYPVEDFVGLYETSSTTAATLSDIICDVFIRFGLPLVSLRGQCYDGAANMSGSVQGVRTRIQQKQPKALYVHCFAHSLNLSVQDSVRSIPFVRDVMQNLRELAKVVHGSAKRMDIFHTIADGIQACDPVTPKPLCPTRWTVRFAAIDAALKSYPALLPFLSEVASMATADDSASKARGLQSQFESGVTLFALKAAFYVFRVTDSLSCSLQSSTATVSGSMDAVQEALSQVWELRSDEFFEKLWEEVGCSIAEYDLQEIVLPRHVNRQAPKRYRHTQEAAAPQSASAPVFASAADYFRVQFFSFVDGVIQHISDRFDQPGMKVYSQLESLLLCACRGEEIGDLLAEVCNLYDDFDKSSLDLQLRMVPGLLSRCHASVTSVSTFADFFRQKPEEVRRLFGEVERLLRLLLVVPASSATAERSFSCLRRLKTYLRSTASQSRLNHMAVLHVHQEKVDAQDLKAVQQEFVVKSDLRRKIFGSFD